MRRYLESGWANFRIEVETGASGVELSGDQITGTWLASPRVVRIGSARPVAVELLNMALGSSPDPKVALKFTKKFGALTVPYCPGSPFRFSIHDWKVSVGLLQQTWLRVSLASRKAIPINLVGYSGEYFTFAAGHLTFRTRRLDTFVTFEIASVPAPRLCMCANWPRATEAPRHDFCKSPYFVASDRREKYCSEACAQIAQKRTKLKWWNENRKGGKNVTQKTR